MKVMDFEEMHITNAGTTYRCPFGCNKTGGYWSVYWHCWSSKCFTKNSWLSALYYGGIGCYKLGTFLKGLISKYPVGKHAM